MAERYLPQHRHKDAYDKQAMMKKKQLETKKRKELQNIATTRADTTDHKAIMKAVQQGEIAMGYWSQIVFMMSVEEFVHLIDTIWRGQSILSQESELFRLALARWDKREEWSPWNCVLLSKEEAKLHEELQDESG